MINIPAVLFFGICTWLIMRSRRVGGLDLVVIALFGFFLGRTQFAHVIADVVNAVFPGSSGAQ